MAPPVVAVVGYTGGVGTCLLSAMQKIGLKPFALVRSTTMKIGDDEAVPVDFAALGERLLSESKSNGGVPVIADVTASSAPQSVYKDWLKQGISVVAANKGIFAGPEAGYKELLAAAAADPPATLLHETTVGAGLPVLGTLGGLVASSHDIKTVEGVLSGTLAFVLSGTLAFVLGAVAGGKKPLSVAVAEAKELGYTEPDPRDDLNGMDVARKAVILARISGMTGIELEAMEIESLVPESLRDCSVDEFLSGLSAFDEAFAERVKTVEGKGGRLHYAAKVDVTKNSVTVGPLACDA
eukprot:CAMPEP_0117004424 /NCGR_PEP_ID=MMETSP0472-20121206/5404_1 /TAXON_ID=693140 ORGANISM="Tiarina fusus, Strain LIS" /NCGR_SAMPLE_ID=MMETSP0472 /ASSEMBLY_ACC=CAM_ASM_000603 /LENGTH=295 /DNA_ID=CAMNT_0004705379 /DNA_START=5 /DNA_END=890 /DNA_ORIENTATION=-